MNRILFKTACLFLMLTFGFQANAQMGGGTTIDSLDIAFLNWYNLDLKENKVMGMSTNKAYADLLDGKELKKKIIVAVIDGGVDIKHEDLEGRIWVNEDEIPDNGIDDDHNGYIDDIHGWNFLGNVSGENINYENYDFVRILAKYRTQFDSTTVEADLDSATVVKYKLYKVCNERYLSEIQENEQLKVQIEGFKSRIDSLIQVLEPYTKSEKPSLDQIKAAKPKDKGEKSAQKYLARLYKYGYTSGDADAYLKHIQEIFDYYLNIDLNARQLIGDNPDDFEDAFYGNNDVKGSDAGHGTFVAGIIAANRNNMGIDGVASHVKIMALRTVPDGDEDDKDVALSIKYAVDNGANIINMSFGKDYSPNKYMVDKAIKYAEEKGVLLVHAAGNSSENNDTITHFPVNIMDNGYVLANWITVGASSKEKGKELPGIFSNYGQTTVDIFAPGVDVISLAPENKYKKANGTSFSCPAVSGVAALVWSYYPELSVDELKSVLLKSVQPYSKKVIVPNKAYSKKIKAGFNTLSLTGGIVNVYNALELAEELMSK